MAQKPLLSINFCARLTTMLYLVFSLFLSSAHAQSAYDGSLLLSQLPNGARLEVSKLLELGSIADEAHDQMNHFCTFENGECTPSNHQGVFYPLNSQLNLKTDVEDALTITEKGGWFGDHYGLLPGIYCLDRSLSKFESGTDNHEDKLKFTDCAGNKVFTIYANAGYTLRNRDGFKGYTISEFEFQSGKVLRFVK
jgi:hypothetical protein